MRIWHDDDDDIDKECMYIVSTLNMDIYGLNLLVVLWILLTGSSLVIYRITGRRLIQKHRKYKLIHINSFKIK